MSNRARNFLCCALVLWGLAGQIRAQSELPAARKYWFGPLAPAGSVPVTPADSYSAEKGYGFDLGSKVEVISQTNPVGTAVGFTRGVQGRPFFFSVNAPPGVYEVTMELGSVTQPTVSTVKAETRRLMLEKYATSNETRARVFLVHVRNPVLPDGGRVRLKARESDPILYLKWDQEAEATFTELNWDDKLTIEVCEEQAALVSLEIKPAQNATTVFIIGDSTVADQMMEPWGAWGHYLTRWLSKPGVAIANHSEHGETTASFIGEQRWTRVLSEMKAGDYVFMQFGINDQRMPVQQFKDYFVRYVKETREKGAFPVLVTSQNLKRMGQDGKAVATLGQHPEAMREVSREMNVPLIDLHAMSLKFYDALGPEKINLAFVDGTHHSNYGAYELAKCVMQGIIDNKLPLADSVSSDWQPYDPSHPAPPESFKLPVDPQMDPARPGGPGAPNGQGPQAGAGNRGRGAAPRGGAARGGM